MENSFMIKQLDTFCKFKIKKLIDRMIEDKSYDFDNCFKILMWNVEGFFSDQNASYRFCK